MGFLLPWTRALGGRSRSWGLRSWSRCWMLGTSWVPASFPPLPGHAAGGCTISSTGRPSQKFGVVGSPGQPLPRFHVSHLPGLTTCFRGYWL